MNESDNKPSAYPKYDARGHPDPVRVPPTEESEGWEMEIIRENVESDPNDPNSPIYRGHEW